MLAFKCDDCGELFESKTRGAYYLVRNGVGSLYRLEGTLDLCDKCWGKMLEKVFPDLAAKVSK